MVQPCRQIWFFPVVVFTLMLMASGALAQSSEVEAAFIKAAFSGDLPEVKRLLAQGVNVNAKRDDGITALMGAAIEGQAETVAFLVSKGADVHAKTTVYGSKVAGSTAYDMAAQKSHEEVMKILARAGAIFEEKTDYRTVKKSAAQESHPVSGRRRDP